MASRSRARDIEALKKRPGSVALRDLARLASVDISTVSRALNHDPRVNRQRSQQIRRLAEEVGYRPRPLRSKLAKSVGLLVSTTMPGRLDRDFQSRITWLAQRLLAARHLHVNIECIDRSAEAAMPALVKQNRVDGVLLSGHPPVEMVTEIRNLGMPAVAINDTVERISISCVRSNPEPAIHQAIVNLAARGHMAFGLLLMDMAFPSSQTRYRSYQATLRELGIEPDAAWLVVGGRGEMSAGREGVRELQQRGALPTAILCENDWIALGVMQELDHQNIRVPEDVSVVGHDDLWICEETEPRLTSIRRSEDAMVAKAIELLLDQIENELGEPQDVQVEGQMIWRQSVGPVSQRLKVADASQ